MVINEGGAMRIGGIPRHDGSLGKMDREKLETKSLRRARPDICRKKDLPEGAAV